MNFDRFIFEFVNEMDSHSNKCYFIIMKIQDKTDALYTWFSEDSGKVLFSRRLKNRCIVCRNGNKLIVPFNEIWHMYRLPQWKQWNMTYDDYIKYFHVHLGNIFNQDICNQRYLINTYRWKKNIETKSRK